jgi:hypothetical protein
MAPLASGRRKASAGAGGVEVTLRQAPNIVKKPNKIRLLYLYLKINASMVYRTPEKLPARLMPHTGNKRPIKPDYAYNTSN